MAYVQAYSDGKVTGACRTMKPKHGYPSQSTPPPFSIEANSSTFQPGDTLLGKDSSYMREVFKIVIKAHYAEIDVIIMDFFRDFSTTLLVVSIIWIAFDEIKLQLEWKMITTTSSIEYLNTVAVVCN